MSDKKKKAYLFLSFLYFVKNFRIFRISELFTESRIDKNRSKPSFPCIIFT